MGYRIRFDSRVSRQTRIEVLTEGILTRRLQRDPALEGVGLVIFDEFHERGLHADLALALCLDSQRGLREDLRVLVMSATLDGAAVARLLGDAPIITSAGPRLSGRPGITCRVTLRVSISPSWSAPFGTRWIEIPAIFWSSCRGAAKSAKPCAGWKRNRPTPTCW